MHQQLKSLRQQENNHIGIFLLELPLWTSTPENQGKTH